MAKIIIKCDPIPFQATKSLLKTFDTRLNDRFYQAGDEVEMKEFDRKTQEYSGERIGFTVGFVSTYMMPLNWVTFSILDVEFLPNETEPEPEDIPF